VGYIALLIGIDPDKAQSFVDELYEVARRSNIRPMMIPAKQMMFNSKFLTTNDLDLAWSCAEEVIELATEINHEIGLTVARLNMSTILSIRGNTARAKELLELALPNDEKRYREYTYQVNGLVAEQFYYAANGDYQSLDRLGSKSFEKFFGGINRAHILYFYSGIFPMILAYQGNKLLAIELLGSAYASKWIRDTWVFRQWKALKDFQANLRQELGDASYEVAWERGKTQDIETLIQQILAQEGQ
jgi:hypothetical protein